MKRVKIVNDCNEVIRECQDRRKIEEEIAKYNKKHYRQAFESRAYQDKLYAVLKHDNIRNKILKGSLRREECNDDDVYEFMSLLKRKGGYVEGSNQMAAITEEEWIRTVKKAKKKSASSVFSKQIYSVYKCALGSQKMTSILVTFYNAVLKKGYYLERWIKLLAVILEKGKELIIVQLRTIQLIEGDLQILMRIFIGGRNDENLEQNE